MSRPRALFCASLLTFALLSAGAAILGLASPVETKARLGLAALLLMILLLCAALLGILDVASPPRKLKKRGLLPWRRKAWSWSERTGYVDYGYYTDP